MKIIGSIIVIAVVAAAAPRAADQPGVQQAVEQFLQHLGEGEFDKVAEDLATKAIVVVARERDGKWTNTFQTGDEWVAALRKNTNFMKFREPITNVKTTVDSDALAYLRADFEVVRDGKARSHGVDQFTLVHEGGRWKITTVAYTSIPNQ